MLKVGVLGAGHLGKIHLKLLQQSSKYQLIGFYDPNKKNAALWFYRNAHRFDVVYLVERYYTSFRIRTQHQFNLLKKRRKY